MSQPRVRRTRDESRELILQAAEGLLVDGGPAAVQVRAIAERVGMTDAGVYHHFGTRQSLLVALLRHGGRRLRRAVREAVGGWAGRDDDLATLVAAVASLYAEGYAALAIALHGAGWRDPGGGLLEPVVQALHGARERAGSEADIDETRLAVAALHQALALEPVYGGAFRRSAGIGALAARDSRPQLGWWTRTLRQSLGLQPD
jgi:AcrR family transcriptional regulator